MLTFEQFRATGVLTPSDIAEDIIRSDTTAPWVMIYEDNLYIEDYGQFNYPHEVKYMSVPKQLFGRYYLMIERDDYITNDLMSLELKIYQFYIDTNPSNESDMTKLTNKLNAYCKEHNLEPRSADEMLAEQQVNYQIAKEDLAIITKALNTAEEHCNWLADFCIRWEKAEQADREARYPEGPVSLD